MPKARKPKVAEAALHRIVKRLTSLSVTTTAHRSTVIGKLVDLLATPGVNVNHRIQGTQNTPFGELVARHIRRTPWWGSSEEGMATECALLLARHSATDVNTIVVGVEDDPRRGSALHMLLNAPSSPSVLRRIRPLIMALIDRNDLSFCADDVIAAIRQGCGPMYDERIPLALLDHPSMANSPFDGVLSIATFFHREHIVDRLLRHAAVNVNLCREVVGYNSLCQALYHVMADEKRTFRIFEGAGAASIRILRAIANDERCAVDKLITEISPMSRYPVAYKILLAAPRFDIHNIRI